jgi:heme exporter protein D
VDALGGYFAMGGYAAYVWPAYGLTFAVLAGLAIHSWQRHRQSARLLERLRRELGPRR